MKTILLKSLTSLALSGLVLCGTSRVLAETESNNTPGTADALPINSTESGQIGSGDEDYFVVTNTDDNDYIQIDFEFNGSGPDTLRLEVYGPNSSDHRLANLLTGDGPIETRYKASYTVQNAVAGAEYFLRVTKASADGTKLYTIAATGSDAVVTPRSRVAVKEGETYPVNVTSSTGWAVSGAPSWVTLSTASGTGNGTVSVTVLPNPMGNLERSATLSVGGAPHKLTQEANPIAENEPNGTPGTATELPLNSTATGSVSNPDNDYFVVPNTDNEDFVQFDLEFNGSGNDTLRLTIYGPDSSTVEIANIITGTGPVETRYKASHTILNPVAGAKYYVRVQEDSADGTQSYSLSVAAPVVPPAALRLTEVDLLTGPRRLAITWQSRPNLTYMVEGSTNLKDWQPSGPPVPSNGASTHTDVLVFSELTRFYVRVRVTP